MCPDLNGDECFKAVLKYQLIRAIEKCEAQGHAPTLPEDPILEAVSATSSTQIPSAHLHGSLIFTSFVVVSAVVQDLFRSHVAGVAGTFYPSACEVLPPQLELMPTHEDPSFEDESESVEHPGEQKEEVSVPDQPSTQPEVVDAFAVNPKQPQWASSLHSSSAQTSKEVQSPSKSVQTDRKKTKWAKQWVESMQKKKAVRKLVPHSRSQDPPPPPRDFISISDPPSPEEEVLEDCFFDDAPTDNDLFEEMALSGLYGSVKPVPYRHACISEAIQAKFVDLHKYRPHVRNALACHVIRHPDHKGCVT